MTTDYRPIACVQHDRLEILVMQRAHVSAWYREASGAPLCTVDGRVTDTCVRNGAEYLLLLVADGATRALRLDLIDRIDNQATGETWRQNPDDLQSGS